MSSGSSGSREICSSSTSFRTLLLINFILKNLVKLVADIQQSCHQRKRESDFGGDGPPIPKQTWESDDGEVCSLKL